MLLVGGEKDLQCNPGDVQRIAEVVRCRAETVIVKDLTHVLRREPGEPTIIGSGKLLNQPVDREVLALLSEWLQKAVEAQ